MASSIRNILMLCGYKGSGKDRLFEIMKSGKILSCEYVFIEPKYSQLVYNSDSIYRIGFADLLKQEVLELYPIPEGYNSDKLKDVPIPNLNIELELENKMKEMNEMKLEPPFSFRDFCLYQAKVRRDQDPEYWVKLAYNKISNMESDKLCVITDFRYPNEYEYLKSQENVNIITIRVFRECVNIPPIELKSEHALDDFVTDFVFIPKINYEQEERKVKELFPQYRKYGIIAPSK